MKNALDRLHRLVLEDIEPLSAPHFTDTELQNHCNDATRDCRQTQQYLQHRCTRSRNKKRLEILVQEYQCSYIQLLDRVNAYYHLHPTHRLEPVYRALIKELDECLQQLRERHNGYFNAEEKAPDVYQAEMRKEISEGWDEVVDHIRKLQTDEQLIRLVNTPIRLFLTNTRSDLVSFRWLDYLGILNDALQKWASVPHTEPVWELIELLLSLNFNTPSFAAFCMRYFIGSSAAKETALEKLEAFCDARRKLYPILPNSKLAFDANLPFIKHEVDDWLADEIRVLECRYSMLSAGHAGERSRNGIPVKEDDDKIDTIFSVPQLIIWARLCIDSGIFLDKNLSRLCRKLSRLFRTREQEEVSAGSLLTKAYAATEAAKDVVREYLMKMFNKVKQY